MALMTNTQFAAALKKIATEYDTVYVLGCFGAPLTSATLGRYLNAYSYNKERESILRPLINKGYFGFDCVCLIKSVLWGWNGDASQSYGGAKYASNGVGDISADQMIGICSQVSTDFTNIEVGELLWMKGHVGVYIGGGLAVECSPAFKGNVQMTACNRNVSGYDRRNWTSHGKLPWIQYTVTESALSSYPLSGENIIRAADCLVRYTGSGKSNTNQWGSEVKLNAHGVAADAPRYGICKTDIPEGGCVLSGHGKASKWLLENLRKGYSVVFESGKALIIPTGDGYVAGENIPRATDQLVIYRNKATTGTNKWGIELLCSSDGTVTSKRSYGVGNSPVPSGGFVLSGHGKASDWLYKNVKVGDRVSVKDHRVVLR